MVSRYVLLWGGMKQGVLICECVKGVRDWMCGEYYAWVIHSRSSLGQPLRARGRTFTCGYIRLCANADEIISWMITDEDTFGFSA